eukprot:TRINITY_DN59832_c0_g1_i1.p1 TRINITY_DN59832_c0_g1~~TRINITY_DN59832_c0_g1_i1.p1  ORF type:complete len:164 (-),score=11.26 TRINITY_DN59832_c0_g1_i1:439-930(-)
MLTQMNSECIGDARNQRDQVPTLVLNSATRLDDACRVIPSDPVEATVFQGVAVSSSDKSAPFSIREEEAYHGISIRLAPPRSPVRGWEKVFADMRSSAGRRARARRHSRGFAPSARTPTQVAADHVLPVASLSSLGAHHEAQSGVMDDSHSKHLGNKPSSNNE